MRRLHTQVQAANIHELSAIPRQQRHLENQALFGL